ncbi:MAG: site-2 protease family protein [Alphaproteobacteria bacterium]|nr:site-2 protease family protein [Alphaproteobacteria bacterium]
MGWSFTIGRIAGTSIRLHFTFVLLLAWIGIADYATGGTAAAISSIGFILLIFACVTAHEFGHIMMARRYGVKTPEVILSPIGGIANMERIPEVPYQELLVAIAGPLVNVVIATVLLAFTGVTLSGMTNMNFEAASLVERLTYVNIMLVAFNLVPAFPMDGGRMLRAILAMRLGPARATEVAARLGQGFAFLFVLLGLFYNPILLIVGVFIYFAATAEEQASALRWFAHGLTVAHAMERAPRLLAQDATLADAIEALLSTSQRDFPVVDGDRRPVGLLDREAMVSRLETGGKDLPVAHIMATTATLHEEDPLDGAVNQLRMNRAKAEIVVGRDGRVTGLLTVENIAEMMMIHSARPDWTFTSRAARR